MKVKTFNNLMLIDDDQDLLDLLSTFFRQRGYQTFCYTQAEEALIDIENDRVLPHVIICDIKLPQMDGLDFVKRMKKGDLRIPIILMTAEGTLETALSAIEFGAYDFVLKPLHIPQLLISVQRAQSLQEMTKENDHLKNFIQPDEIGLKGVIAKSPGFKNALDLARRVSSSMATILISGESGSGKEVIARAVHDLGDKKSGPFIAINCSAIPENLLESELFGHARGAFTGAQDKKIGLFEEANSGTLFLDEIGDLSLPLQAKLLRVLQERKIKRLGENHYREISARLICATHKDLKKEIIASRFREDLYFRLNVIPIHIPPLRERREDIIPLSEFFLKKFTLLNKTPPKQFSKEALLKLESNLWSGNVRELENAIERAVVLSESNIIQTADLPASSSGDWDSRGTVFSSDESFSFEKSDDPLPLEDVSKKYIQFIYEKNHGAKEQTARDLGIDRKTLYRKLKEMNIDQPAKERLQ